MKQFFRRLIFNLKIEIGLAMFRQLDRMHLICWSSGGGDAPSPDPQIGAAALKNAQLGQDAFDFYKQEYLNAKPAQEELNALAKQVQQQLVKSGIINNEIAADYQKQIDTVYRPLEKSIVDNANAYDTAGRREQEAAAGLADVNQTFDAQRQQTQRNNERMGINPNSGNSQALDQQMSVSQAVAGASAMNKGRKNAETMGNAMKMDAASLGRNLPSNQATSQQIANNSATSAVNTGLSIMSNDRAQTGMMQAGYGTAMQGYNNQANILNNQYQAQSNAYQQQQANNAQGWAGLGTLAGMYMMRADGGVVDDDSYEYQGKPLVRPFEEGNIDLSKRPKVKNPDGSISTVRSIGVNVDGVEVLIPTVSDDGRMMDDDEAYQTFMKTGKHLGKFKTVEDAERYGQVLHEMQAKFYGLKDGGMVDADGDYDNSKPGEDESNDHDDIGLDSVFTGTGPVRGKGTSTSDDIHAKLSNGEFVLNAEATQMIGLDTLNAINKAGLKKREGATA